MTLVKYKKKGCRGRLAGFKLTPQRIAILKFLDGNTSHPSADDIYGWLKRRYPSVSFATVYNTLLALKKRGELIELTIDPVRRHFDPNPNPHHHTICLRCGTIGDVFTDYSALLLLPKGASNAFTVTGNHINFYGVCKDCGKLNRGKTTRRLG